ncbi:hypothetical protein [Mesorhizobium sp. WSM2239]|uniref:Cell wall-binding protein n=2 Tax=unclassified Mesorhizobium TaxID=325217 RepID=A0AAU8DA57_9HYPH
MAVRWIYDTEGKPAYYQEGQYVYTQTGTCEFFENGGWWYRMHGGGAAAYYVSNGWVYTPDGKAVFHYGDRDD